MSDDDGNVPAPAPLKRREHTVVCVACKTGFAGFSHDQANGCAADVHDTCVVGHYGSTVADMHRFDFAPGRRPDLPAG